jgi:hypothetical protein
MHHNNVVIFDDFLWYLACKELTCKLFIHDNVVIFFIHDLGFI